MTVTRAMAMVTGMTWAMATVMRLVGNKEGKGEGGKGNGDGDRVAGNKKEIAMVARAMAMVTRVGGEQWQL